MHDFNVFCSKAPQTGANKPLQRDFGGSDDIDVIRFRAAAPVQTEGAQTLRYNVNLEYPDARHESPTGCQAGWHCRMKNRTTRRVVT